MADNRLILAVPSKGALREGSIESLVAAGMKPVWDSARSYVGTLKHPDNVSLLAMRAEEIVHKVAEGAAHVGLTGEDIVSENLPPDAPVIMIKAKLGFGRARLVVAIPEEWIDVDTIDDLLALLPRFRERHLRSLQIATKFPNLTRDFFTGQHRSREYTLVRSMGATEAAPTSGLADMIVDLTSTGTTLRENRLKELEGGTILSTEACLIAHAAPHSWPEARRETLRNLLEPYEASMHAKGSIRLDAECAAGQRDALAKLCQEHEAHLVHCREDAHGVGLGILARRGALSPLIGALRGAGAKAVAVSKPEMMFLERSEIYRAFLERLSSSPAR